MGNGFLAEMILSSPEMDELTLFEEVIFFRLIFAVDESGFCCADPVLLARRLYPRKENFPAGMLEEALDHLEQHRLIFRFEGEEDRLFLKITEWDRYQQASAEIVQQPDPSVIITLPLKDGTEFPLTQKDAEEFAFLYPLADVIREFRAMRGWCLYNEKKRKDRYGILPFINAWMTRAQHRRESAAALPGRPQSSENPYLTMISEGVLS